jgi:hypothetical protein
MFGFRRRREKPPVPSGKEYHCSFCNKSQRAVRMLISGPKVFICDECVDICVDILAESRKDDAVAPSPMLTVRCALCRLPIDAEPALLVEKRGVLCPPCVAGIEASLDARDGSVTPSSPPSS